MNRKSPPGRSPDATKTVRISTRRASSALHLEPLEDRKMLAVYLNELFWDPPSGGDIQYEYVELRGTPNMSLDDHYLIIVENEGAPNGDPGVVDTVFDLSGTSIGANGFLTLRQKNNHPTNQYTVAPGTTDLVNTGGNGWGSGETSTVGFEDEDNNGVIENSGGTFMLIKNNGGAASAPFIDNDGEEPYAPLDLDVDNNGLDVPTGHADWEILDAIGVHAEVGEAAAGRLYAPINFGVGPTANLEPGAIYVDLPFEIEYLGRWGDSTGQTADDWHAANLTDNGSSGFSNMGDYRQSANLHGLGTFGQVPESSQTPKVPYGTNLTDTLGATNFQNASIEGRHVFYNQSVWDGNDPAAGAADNGAIATDKSAYLPGDGAITPDSMTSYTRGLNGIMVDIAHPNGTITADDFIFRMSNQGGGPTGPNNTPSTWLDAPTPLINVLADTPSAGIDRVEMIWDNNAIENRYLEVIVKGADSAGGFNFNTGLPTTDIFFFGNIIGDTFENTPEGGFATTATDEGQIRAAGIAAAPITSPWDIDRNGGQGLATDQAFSRANAITGLTKIDITNPPAAPVAADGANLGAESAIASALAVPSVSAESKPESSLTRAEPVHLSARAIARQEALVIEGHDPRKHVALDVDVLGQVAEVEDELLTALAVGWRAAGSRQPRI